MKKIFFLLALAELCFLSSFAQFQSGERIVIDKSFAGDLYIAAGEIEINAPVKGDVIGAGGKLLLTDTVWQDLLAAGSQISMLGNVHDDMRCAGGEVEIVGTVDDDLLVFGGMVHLSQKALVKGNVLVFGGQVVLDGEVKGKTVIYGGEIKIVGNVDQSLDVKGGEIEINGSIGRSAKISAEKLHFGPKARIGGDLNYWTKEKTFAVPEGVVQGKITFKETLGKKDTSPLWFLGGAAFTIGLFLLLVLSGFLIIFLLNLFFGKYFMQAAETFKQYVGENIGFGFLYLIGMPILIVLLMAIIIGFPIGLFLLCVYLFSLFFSHAAGSLLFVHYLNQHREKHWGASIIILLSLGFAVLIQVISFIPVLGWLFSLLVFALTYGTLINHYVKIRKKASKV